MRFITCLAAGLILSLNCHADDKPHAPHWGYNGPAAPDHWADLDAANQTCKLSREQSPIDIEVGKVAKGSAAPLDFHYKSGSAEVVNNGHTVQVNLPVGSKVKIDDAEVALLQFHFHTPSEEKFDGKAYPLVAHFVHKSADGKLYVVAVLLKEGKKNAALDEIFNNLPMHEGDKKQLAKLDPAAVLPAGHSYYRFMGSLTTPPCSDGVHWQVLKDPVELSAQQLASFRKLYTMNARPVQPLNARVVELIE